jgi:outer membrane immunogenic protein
MKTLLVAGVAAALFGAPALAASPPPVFNWSGFYAGGHIGSVVQDGQLNGLLAPGFIIVPPTPQPPVNLSGNGVLGGGQLGYNWQWANWVAGFEADISASHLSKNGPFDFSALFPPIFVSTTTGTAQLTTDIFTTARARLGYAVGNLLFFGSGGFAWVREKLSTSGVKTTSVIIVGTTTTPFSSSDTSWIGGWSAGGGVDYAFAPNWFVRMEYLHIGVGTKNFTVDPTLSGTPLPVSSHFDIVRFGLNYKFGSQ